MQLIVPIKNLSNAGSNKEMISNSDAHIEDLIKIGALNLEDLEVNRVGLLSERQKRMLYIELGFWFVLTALEIVAFVMLAYYHIFILGNWDLVIFEIPVFVILIYWCKGHIEPLRKDLKADKPKSVTGQVTKRFSYTGGERSPRIGYCTIRIEDEVFSVSPSIYDQLIPEKPYRVYYVTNTRKLINIESLLTFKESNTANT